MRKKGHFYNRYSVSENCCKIFIIVSLFLQLSSLARQFLKPSKNPHIDEKSEKSKNLTMFANSDCCKNFIVISLFFKIFKNI